MRPPATAEAPADLTPRFDATANHRFIGAVLVAKGDVPFSRAAPSGEQLLTRLYDPLCMTCAGLDAQDLILPRRASGYKPRAGVIVTPRLASLTWRGRRAVSILRPGIF